MYSICRKFKVSSYELLKRNPALKRGVKAGMTIIVPIKDEKMLAEQEKAPAEEIIQSEAEVNALLSVPAAAFQSRYKVGRIFTLYRVLRGNASGGR